MSFHLYTLSSLGFNIFSSIQCYTVKSHQKIYFIKEEINSTIFYVAEFETHTFVKRLQLVQV